MATVKTKCVFKVEADQCIFKTQTNGDKIHFGKGIHLSQDDATALAYMLQSGKQLKVVIKET